MAVNPSPMALDWLFVVSAIFSVLLTIVYLFYSNRILAFIIGYLLHLSWWNEGSDRTWVSLESFQVSLLAGRIMIKDLRYYSSNQSFRAIKCRVTWRYWFWRTRDGFNSHVPEEEHQSNKKASTLPSRLHVALEGVEWRLFNRSAAHNNILLRLQRHSNQSTTVPDGRGSSVSGQSRDLTAFASDGGDAPSGKITGTHRYPPSVPAKAVPSRLTMFGTTFAGWFADIKPKFHEILPIDVAAERGAIVLGNQSTPTLLVARFSQARGSYSVVPSKSIHDKFKTVIDVKFQNVKFDMLRNDKYRGPLVQHGKVVLRHLAPDPISSHLPFSIFTQLWSNQKRSQTQHQTDDLHAAMKAGHEEERSDYAIVETILESPRLELSYYWDEPGMIPSLHREGYQEGIDSYDVGNGDLAPEFGIDVVVHGGTVRYGPWADRQRVELQRVFFPPTYQTVEVTPTLKPGDTRIYTALKAFVEMRDTITFHIPFREPSKDWQFDETKFPGSTRKRREGGWLEVHAGGNSTISYVLPWVAKANGFDALLELHLDQVSALSSVNDIQLLRAESSRVLCELPTPRRWNDSRQWKFDVSFRTPTIHLIRDHINLLTDLGKDWSAGPPSDFDKWIPMQYLINVSLHNFEVNLYLNDHNIITHPHARDANSLLTLRGNLLRSVVEMPFTVFRPMYTKIPFWIEVPGVKLTLTLPRWNPHAIFASSRTTDFGSLGFLRVDSSFLYYSKTLLEHIDQLRLDIIAHDIVFISFGWVVRHLMNVRDNYFGNFTHFSTLTEYVTKRNKNVPVGDPLEWKWREGKSNVFEVSLGVQVERSVMVFPAGLPGYEFSLEQSPSTGQEPMTEFKGLGTSVIVLQPELQLQLRTHDYSMEMSLNISPMIISVVENLVHSLLRDSYQKLGRQKLQIDGANVVANRLFGPQPKTSTYLCLWEFQIGTCAGIASTMELQGLSAALTSFRVNFIDPLSAPASDFATPPEPDVTFLKFNLKSLDVAWVACQTSLQLCLPHGIKFDSNDLAGNSYKKLTEVRVSQVVVRALLRSGMRRESWLEAGSTSFDVGVDTFYSPQGWREAAQVQAKFVAAQDALTRRACFLYENSSTPVPPAYNTSMFLPRPTLPGPHIRGHKDTQGTDAPRKSRRSHSNAWFSPAADSDEDEHISEADRDARLAHSRPATPLMFNQDYDDRSMSSSDESDNDITSSVSDSDSDEAEQNEPNVDNVRRSSPLPSHYKNIVRRFEAQLDNTSIFWTPFVFNLVRDITPPPDDFPRRATPSIPSTPNQFQFHRSSNSSLNPIVRLIRTSRVEVLLTPLCMHVIKSLSNEIFDSIMSMELVVDSLTKQYLGDLFKETPACASQEILDAKITAFRLRILQNLGGGDENLASTLPNPPLPVPGNPRIISDIVLSIHDITASFSELSNLPDSMSNKLPTFRGSFSKVKAHLDASVFHPLSQMNRTPKVSRQCILEIDGSKTVFTSDSLHVKLGDARVQTLGKTSPEIVTATIDSLRSFIRETATHVSRTSHIMAVRQRQIWNILESRRSTHIEDPLTLIQPSILVQQGRPQRIRRDANWKLFVYLRHCLRFYTVPDKEKLVHTSSPPESSFSPVQLDDLLGILHEKLSGWSFELSRQEVALLPFVRYCFASMVDSSTTKPRDRYTRLPVISFHSGTLAVSVFERPTSPDGTLGNTFALGPFRLAYRYRKQELMVLPVKVSGASVSKFLDSATTRHHVLSAVVEDVRYTIHPSFIVFLQRLLRLHGKYASTKPTTTASSSDPSLRSDDYWECFVDVKQISIQAAVEGMVLAVGLTKANLAITLLCSNPISRSQPRSRRFTSGHCLLKSHQLYTHVRQADDRTEPFGTNGRDILTSLAFSTLILDTSYRTTGEHPPVVHGLLAMDSLLLNVPRSALLTYRLIEEWRIQYLTNIHFMTNELVAELDKRQKEQLPNQRQTRRALFPIIELQTSVKRVGMSLQVMHGTWFSWDVHDIVGFLRSVAANTRTLRTPRFSFGVQLASQLIQIGAQPGETMEITAKCINLPLPAFRASGNYDGSQLRSHAIIDYISLPLKPNYMDDILVVQQNLGTHFYDVLDLISESRKNRASPEKSSTLSIKYNVAFMLQGFRIGIEAPTTTLALTSGQMTGTSRNENGSAWEFAVSNLALALSHHSTDTWLRSGFDRSLRSAYMVLDVKASDLPATSSGEQVSRVLRLKISRMHAVMSPNSIGELGDLVDHVQAEQHIRQEQRALELEEIKKKTKRVMRAFEVPKATISIKRSSSLLDNRTLLIDVADIGIAFPLALRNEIEVDAIGSVPAFLLSVKTATFSVKRYESGHASMHRLSFQFVRQFDQSNQSQFDGDQHQSRNKLLYPGMKADVRTGSSSVIRQCHVSAYVDGFVLVLDPTIVDNVFGLIDVYRKGRERIDRLSVLPQTTKLGSDDIAASMEASYLAVRTSNILITLVFQTGKLHLHGLQPDICGGHSLPLDVGFDAPDVIDFPTITVWGDYRATPAASKISSSQDQEPSVLMFGSQVHATTNRIEPSIFLFLLGFTGRIEDRLRHPESESLLSKPVVSSSSRITSGEGKDFLAPGVFNGIQLSFSLRIDSSRLELDCAHDLGVVAALHWESGGFLFTISPRARIAHFSGSVTGLQVDLRHLKHQAGTVQTAKADARNLAFSVSYSQVDGIEGVPTHSVSVVMDTEFGAAVRFDRLQDILIFKAIYIDRLPGTVPQPSTKSTTVSVKSTGGIPGLTVLLLIRARHLKVLVDLGHNVAAAVVDLESLILRSRIAGSVTDLSLSIAHTSLDLEEDRPLGGFLRLPNFTFTTVRRSNVQLGMKDGISRMLDVTLKSGALDIVLQSEKRTLLQYNAQPFEIRITDDWSAIDWNLLPEERTLRLDFSVVGMDVLAVANLQSVPRIINLISKLRSDLDLQQNDARNALTISSIAQLPKPNSALTEVADAMIRSARSQFSDGPAFSYIILQRMKLKLSNLRLALFKNPNDLEMALFQGKDVRAELERTVHSPEMPPTRSLKLAFSSLYFSKYASLKYRSLGDELMAVPWLERLLQGASEWTIARVPAMKLEMNSDIKYEGRQEILEYDLVATADDRAQSSRSIYVSLNLSLYIWAGALVKGLGIEIEKALATTEFNKPATRAIAETISPPSHIPPETTHGEDKTKTVEGTPSTSPPLVSQRSPPTVSATMPEAISALESHTPLPRKYHARTETSIDYGTIEQLGEATPDAKAPWLGLKETVPPRVHEYATLPMEVLMKMLLEVYSKQLKMATTRTDSIHGGIGSMD